MIFIEKRIYITILYDFYKNLLTNKQKKVFEMYYFFDNSLSEIAELISISKQGVSDSLKKTESSLNKFEEALNLFSKYQMKSKYVTELFEKFEMSKELKENLEELKYM